MSCFKKMDLFSYKKVRTHVTEKTSSEQWSLSASAELLLHFWAQAPQLPVGHIGLAIDS